MLNYRQLHYFWVVAKTGSIVRACEQLNLTPQTISGQITLLEQTYGIELFRRVGRQLELTEAGRQTLPYAEQMFQLGGELEAMLQAQPNEQQILFRVGVADVVPKSIVYRLIAPTMELSEPIRITCREDKLERLLADLAIQRLDLVISDSPMPSHLDIKGYSQKLGECGISFFATEELAERYGTNFPHSLHGAPLLIPGQETVVRSRLLRWLAEQQIQPRIIGEFDDSALMQAFGQSGSGIFISPSVIADEVRRQYGVQLIGQTDAVSESFYAISVERKVKHPGIVAITEGARRELFTAMGA
ncbi:MULTISPECIES: transcriptional activator NhaR [Pseudomonas]|jgi:LysR family transcriptional activator of nhaA|uniref:Transcriptional activator NhaR n=4 Tax=Pseudomonas chlororaphis TaxID=587753 RepID=A0A0E1ECD7_9PSED|nr:MULTISPECIES: transcriptional activator NhaR [Pseudomonas]AIC21102.1 LysR family transcriptional regulator [Pseudomonas chlororaphis]AIS12230.1 LysR family transcriptional regulator [Pseudomonas chlororaphis subsp. aurantiaca]AUG41992.1 transcriptional activator NhaR [Pseudomonas chlororaphis]AZD23269.1 Transcriptional regulator, LysR family [Pseudomonas chlororaphis subsp. aurantiaca]AZD36865.1 Transcriptional regulator, LysR family [Pseudomonas chlororaphis subsp. aurantiaca]